ncbi:MAG: hypothetical protein CMG74_11560 [Candidatus Marinimicrobia bacterium]|nr:hypothetical protein [Candidatus Neomarinimicrobiota bacterium]|tara:strand:- start:2540 stop:3766 length:1227 start_codon:yes stop_codon:yes gene_type:complete
MNQIWIILKWEFINRVRSKLFIITTFLLPFFMVGMMYVPAILMDLEPETITKVGLVYEDSIGALIERFKKQITNNYSLKNGNPQFLFNRSIDEIEALDSVAAKSLDGYLHIPSSILDTGSVHYYSHSLSNVKLYGQLRRTLNQVVIEERMISQNIDIDIVGELSRNINFETFEVDRDGYASEGDIMSSFFIPYLFLMILFMTIFMSGQLLLRSVIEERNNRTIEILLSSVKPDELMVGKIMGLGALGLTQMVFYLLVGLITAHYRDMAVIELRQLPIFLIYFTTGYLFFASIYAAMGTLFTSEQEAQQTSGIIGIIAVLPLIFASYFITNPGSSFTVGISYFPPLTPFMMILRLGTGTVDWIEILLTTIIMIISCWGMIKLSGKIFRTAILLYGKRATMKEIIHWVKA